MCLCGSTRFKNIFFRIARKFTLRGYIILMPNVFKEELSEETKQELDRLHFQKIIMSDVVYIVNPSGYIGDSTKREIKFALLLDKKIMCYAPIDVSQFNVKSVLPIVNKK